MKGPSLSSPSRIARELADAYKHPLIDEVDITKALESIHPASSSRDKVSNERFRRLIFEVLYHLASAQLNRQISVTVNTTLSDRAYLDRLALLARSMKACLIIIECDAQDQQNAGYGVPGDIPKLSVNTKSLFSSDEVISNGRSMALPHTGSEEPLQDCPSGNVLLQSTPSQEKVPKESDRQKPINDHLHALSLSEKPRKDKLVCKSCFEFISDQNYHCEDCDEFILHKSCAEAPDQIKAIAQNCPRYLRELSPRCYDCLLETNLQGGFLPAILHHRWHEHPLNFIIMPHGFNYQYLCCTCGKLGKSISYKCYDCNYDLHINCVLLPTTVSFKSDKHRLSLVRLGDYVEYNCDICKEKGGGSYFCFLCRDCDLAAHIWCMPDLNNSTEKTLARSSKKTITRSLIH
ncbi:hypothetical protein SADUNF_Sadunf09G0123900 [Salix dunnii]|uniref:DC1 domain-containing protein n=1 Tax=Salix dunnii TaxID=1413687 RepID=A0A835MTQ0_9ROSI|nr:hypothetical protein SADUNF_Sadunf09G0123900 [Salix dunnii]